MKRITLLFAAASLVGLSPGCTTESQPGQAPGGLSEIQAASAHRGRDAGTSASNTSRPMPLSPENGLPASGPGSGSVTGKVTEVIEAGQYVYVCVNSGNESQWLATNAATVQIGDSVEFEQGLLMRNFKSPSMGRVFPAILFVEALRITNRPSVSISPVQGLPSGHPAIPESARSASRNVGRPRPGSIPTLKDTMSIESIHENQATLSGKSIAAVGMVSKVSANVMGRNWIHLIDEEGRELVVTSASTAAPGSIMVARGTLVIGKSFETGYYIPLMVEDATLAPGS